MPAPLPLLLALAFAAAPDATLPDAATIMARVAANQDRSEAERTHFIYVQHAHVTSSKGSTVHCEETTDTRIVPTASGNRRVPLKLDGRLLVKGKYVTYTELPAEHKDDADDDIHVRAGEDSPMDRDLAENMRDNLTKSKGKDGLGAGLFPLTSAIQAEYTYHLAGSERMNGRDVFHITFEPKDKDDYGWKGDAYIDRTAFEPVVVRTAMSRKLPFAVRTLLGTSLPGLGFTVVYAPQPGSQTGTVADDLWFPVSFGTEFKLHVLFFLNRTIVLTARNDSFERTHVKSTILPGEIEAKAGSTGNISAIHDSSAPR